MAGTLVPASGARAGAGAKTPAKTPTKRRYVLVVAVCSLRRLRRTLQRTQQLLHMLRQCECFSRGLVLLMR